MRWDMAMAASRFEDARSKALVAGLLDLLRRRPGDLLSFADVRACLNVRGQHALGRQYVALDHIIGSEGRYHDFDRQFRPLTDKVQTRWSSVERALLEGLQLPPVELYKVGDVYFVRDGNHRVSVARHLGIPDIDAEVIELLVDVPLTSALSMRNLLLTEEYSDFLEWTSLHDLRPDERIVFSELGGYLDLVRHINLHRYALARACGQPIERDQAVASWYDHIYMPTIRQIRDQKKLRRFTKRTEADLYRWMADQGQIEVAAAPVAVARGRAESLLD